MVAADSTFQTAKDGKHNFEMLRKNSFSKLSGSVKRVSNYADEDASPLSADARSRLATLMGEYSPADAQTIQKSLVRHIEYSLAKNRWNCDDESMYRAAALSIRDRLLENFNDTNAAFFKVDPKRVYYLSLEFLVGRAMQNALVNLDLESNYKEALKGVGFNLETLYEYEHDAALGNGGLGRLAACFLDSCATLNLPVWGYGIRYTYGIFEQKIVQGRQVEYPDYWLTNSNPWEIERSDVRYAVRFGGRVEEYQDSQGRLRHKWVGGKIVQAEAYDNPLPGFDTSNCISLRLWRARPSSEFDFHAFNEGDYLNAVEERQDAESISAVLYPNDNSESGKELRLKQQFFFVCATIQDVLRRFKKIPNREWKDLPSKMNIQLNDTHPTIAIPELMRILIDVEGLDWDFSWDLCREVFCYTNHTVLQEALEKWDAGLIGKLLPRHLLIINEINYQFLQEASRVLKDDWNKISKMSIYEEGDSKKIRMANLAVIGSKKVNGVAAIHSNLVKRDLFPEFVEFYGKKGVDNKFVNMTNGVTTRRWVHNSNRKLSNLISETLGSDDWLKDFSLCAGLAAHASDPTFQNKWEAVKLSNKKRFANWIKHNTSITVDPEFMFNVQVKRIHEYKRQLMFNFWMIYHYLEIKEMSHEDRQKVNKRVSMIGGKAAPGYKTAKTIIKMTSNIANIVNNDSDVSPYFKVVFLPNYNVSSASIIIPGTDITEQISTAGLEASGTGNMKFVMNGAPIIGTMDGATVEICEEIGENNCFIFGAYEEATAGLRENARNGNYPVGHEINKVFESIYSGFFSNGENDAHSEFCGVINQLKNNGNGYNGDHYLVIADFPSYVEAQRKVDRTYQDRNAFLTMSIEGVANMGKFSSDRSMIDYSRDIWQLSPVDISAVSDKYGDVTGITRSAPSAPAKVVAPPAPVPAPPAPVAVAPVPVPVAVAPVAASTPAPAVVTKPAATSAPLKPSVSVSSVSESSSNVARKSKKADK